MLRRAAKLRNGLTQGYSRCYKSIHLCINIWTQYLDLVWVLTYHFSCSAVVVLSYCPQAEECCMESISRKEIIDRAAALQYETRAFIDGAYVDALSGKTLKTENPATLEKITDIAGCGKKDVDRAVAAARKSFDSGDWSRMSPQDRKEVLISLAELIEEHKFELALLDCIEAGKPISECLKTDVPETADCFRWHAEASDKLFGTIAPTAQEQLAMIVREPVGVVGAVVPWNFPLLMAAWKAAPALAMGNSIVLKPSELTSLSAIKLAGLAIEAGIPPGVFNVVPGLGEEAGKAIGLHPDIDMVTFTGSNEVGRLFLQYAAQSNMKRVTLECGGKSPQIIFDDAGDLEYVAGQVLNAAFWNMGENCSCGSRLIVHSSIQERLLELLKSGLESWSCGDPMDPATQMGPMVEKAHFDKVKSLIESGRKQGAQIINTETAAACDLAGHFIQPLIFAGVRNDMEIAQEEIFGPVLSVLTFTGDEEAIELANDSKYGLAASLYTKDIDRAIRVSRALRAGTVSVNCFAEGSIATPFGGYKESGFGGRDNGIEAFDQYCEIKTIWIQIED